MTSAATKDAPATEKLAIHGGRPAKTTPYATGIRFGKDEEEAALAALRSQRLWYIGGTRVLEAEKAICNLYGARHAVLCSSGTAAIHVALAVCGVEAGDEVIVNPASDWGSVMGILALGAIPVFADIEEESFSLDPACVEKVITPRTKAILLVHLAGYPAQVKEIAAIAKARGLKLVEDCAQSHDAFLDGQPLGTFGDISAFSTNDSKIISCGEGGFVMTNNPVLAKMSRLFTDKGYDRSPSVERGSVDVGFLAWNYRMSELSAAVLTVQIRALPELVARRKHYFDAVLEGIGDLPGYQPLRARKGALLSCWNVLGRLDLSAFTVDRKTVVAALAAEGVPAGTGLSPSRLLYGNSVLRRKSLYPMSPGKPAPGLASHSYDEGLCPVAERVVDSVLVLGCSPFYSEKDAAETVVAMRKVLTHYHR